MKTTAPLARTGTSGFTLLEVAIVIVIVALLVGGLAGFRTYIRNAELNNMMNEGKFFIDAYNKFQSLYGAPPGDYASAATAWTEAVSGDGNGLIREHATADAPLERYYAWEHLALAGMIPGKYTGAVNGNGGASIGSNIPGASVKGVGFIFEHPDAIDGVVAAGDTMYFAGMYPNVLIVAGNPDNNDNIPDEGFLTPKQALQLDEKFDDGIPGGGNITPQETGATGTCTDTDAAATALYLTSSDAKACYFIIKVQ